ncbi:hypothetical protein [Rhizobium leguminosarum]|uniref:hypothetical protein n=1 Tax=Rhizobium leguminosarum TaxID=384 RepID=UPI001CDCDDF7|nr:hypothetical protein [Rhizobium leguminosarum]
MLNMIGSDMSNLSDEVKRLRGLRVSVQDIMRQTGLSMFEVYEFSEGREIAVRKMARLHFVRGTGWPWDEMASDPDNQHQPTGDYALDAVRAIINLMSGTKLDDPVRQQLNEMTEPERKRIIEVGAEIIRMASRFNKPEGV